MRIHTTTTSYVFTKGKRSWGGIINDIFREINGIENVLIELE
jgi:hypothetical protein